MLSYRLIASLVLALGLLGAALAGCDTASPPPDELRVERTGSPARPMPKSEEEIPDSLDVVSGPEVTRAFPVDAIVEPPEDGNGSLAYDSIEGIVGGGKAELQDRTTLVYTSPRDFEEGQREERKTPVREEPVPNPPPEGEPPTPERKADPPPSSPEELDRGQRLEGRTDEVQSRQPTSEGRSVRSQGASKGFQPDTDTVRYTVSYGDAMNTGTLAVILEENDPPQIETNEGVKVDEGGATTITTGDLSASDPNPDDTPQKLTFMIQTTPANGEIRVRGTVVNEFTQQDILDGVVTYAHKGARESEDQFSFQVSDPQGATQGKESQVFGIDVNPDENQRPIAEDDAYETSEEDRRQVLPPGVLDNDDDPDGNNDSLTVAQVQGSPDNVGAELTLNSGAVASVKGNGEFSYNPNDQFERLSPDESASDTLTYVAEDERGGRDTATVQMTITGVNDAPSIAENTGITLEQGETRTIAADQLQAEDPDHEASALTYTVTQKPTQGDLSETTFTQQDLADETVTYSHTADNEDNDSFNFELSDPPEGGDVDSTFQIMINARPTANNDSDQTDQGKATTTDVLVNDTDPDGSLDESTVTVQREPDNGETTANEDGTITYDPAPDFFGTDSYMYTVKDDEGAGSNEAKVTIDVNGRPVANDDSDQTIEQQSTTTDVLANDSDPDGDGLDASTVTVQSSPSSGSTTIESDGSITYTPDAVTQSSFEASYTYTVADTAGAESEPATVTITVDEAPVADDDSAQTDQGEPVTTDVLANDSDSDGILQASTVTVQSSPSSGSTTIESDGSITYDPNESLIGTDDYTYTVEDDAGNESNAATVTIDVNGRPVASDDIDEVNQEGATTTDVLANDTDPDGSLDESTVTVQSDPSHGTITDVNGSTGAVTYEPNPDFTGEDTYTYTVKDGEGGESNAATVTVDVNARPVAVGDADETIDQQTVTTDVLANDSDPDGELAEGTVEVESGPDQGAAAPNNDGTVTYVPPGVIQNSFQTTYTYTVEDTEGAESEPATVTITVDEAPVANDDSAQTTQGQSTTTDVLANDSDPEDDTSDLTVTVEGDDEPSNGTVTVNGDGTITYTPDSGFVGEDSYTYTVEDTGGNEAEATVTIDVQSSN